jgi:hypothetical protein
VTKFESGCLNSAKVPCRLPSNKSPNVVTCKVSVFKYGESQLKFFDSLCTSRVRFEGKYKVRPVVTRLAICLTTLTCFELHDIGVKLLWNLCDRHFVCLSLMVLENISAPLYSKVFELQLSNCVSTSSSHKHNRKVQVVYKIFFAVVLQLHKNVMELGVSNDFLAHLDTTPLKRSAMLGQGVTINGKVESSQL